MRERDIFIEALSVEPSKRPMVLDRACCGDPALRAKVDCLLVAHERQESFILDRPPAGLGVTVDQPLLSERPGTVIGPYKLLQQIGEGGMGVVFMAEQSVPIQRTVALKIIKPGMDTRQVIARFEAERQALALMDHPNVAKVLDAGATESGLPYFVMELVRGVPITTYCDQKRLSLRGRLELLLPVCHALQHAHQRGLIHRDIKPSNVMVAEYDDQAVPKVIDFGVAKAIAQRLTDKTMFTEFGQLVGTVEYMSPEQAKLNQLEVDTRSDIYSLGVLLYELLTGSTPHRRDRLSAAAFDEMLRIVREEEPPKPSTRLSTAEGLPLIAANRGLEPSQLNRMVRGELDWVVMKALDKDRNRRYQSPDSLAADIGRFLHNQAVEACPPSITYKMRKLAKRNKAAVSTAAAILATLLLATAASTWQAIRAMRAERVVARSLVSETSARKDAEAHLERTRAAVEEFFGLVSQDKLFDVPSFQPLRKDLLEAAVRYYEGLLKLRPDDPALLVDLAIARLRIAPVYRDFDRSDDCINSIDAGLDCVERLRRDFPNDKLQQIRLAGYWKPLRGRGKDVGPKDEKKVDRTLTKMVNLWEGLHSQYPTTVGFESDLAAAYSAKANWRMRRGYVEDNKALQKEAFEIADRSIALWEGLCRAHPDVPDYPDSLQETLADTVYWLRRTGDTGKANTYKNRYDQMSEELVSRFPRVPRFQSARIDLIDERAKASEAAGQIAKADELYLQELNLARKLDADFPGVPDYTYRYLRSAAHHVRMSRQVGRTDSALGSLRSEMASRFAALLRHGDAVVETPEQRWANVDSLNQLGDLFLQFGDEFLFAGDSKPAESAFHKCLELCRTLATEFPEEPKYQIRLMHSARMLGGILKGSQRCEHYAEAQRVLTQLHKDYPANGEYLAYLISTGDFLASALQSEGRRQEATAAWERLIVECERAPSSFQISPHLRGEVTAAFNNAAWSRVVNSPINASKASSACALAERAVTLQPSAGRYWETLGVARCRLGKWDEAVGAFYKAMEIDGGTACGWFGLSICESERNEHERAKQWFLAASLWMAKYAPENRDLRSFRRERQSALGVENQALPSNVDVAAIGRALSTADPELKCFWTTWGRAETSISGSNWTAAVPDAIRAAELRPEDDVLQFQVAALLARAGDEAAYTAQRRKLLARHADTTDPMWAERTAKVCLLLPVVGEDLDAASRMAAFSVKLDEHHWGMPYAQVANAMAAFRRGEFQVCIEWCDKVLTKESDNVWFRNTQAIFMRSMSLSSLNQYEEAQSDFERGQVILMSAQDSAKKRLVIDSDWHDLAISELIQQEAEKLLAELDPGF